ncbi:glycosyl transferase family 9 [Thermodesulfatator indicus DSM 15286]|uniref:Glycosyl transferase family 9 n=1 Tax=Thermodesulfatator indicus (strain DSM 15286 / JCM 11887 / CIR29812) TaxID=667014 RepID=F8AB38_THEID|nr:glycosyltransferase family 9 protein [Thermodesulfatator indicus]AEH44408.1 glycosyl transferase family 9 [Thermodesulfatator indicus DSM 15286]
MIALWHEGALGDLLIARLAIKALKKKYTGQKLVLFARHEVRLLFKEAGLVDEAWPTSLSLLEKTKRQLSKAYVFTHQKELGKLLTSLTGISWQEIPTRPPGPEIHLALAQWQKVSSSRFSEKDLFLEDRPPKDRFVFIHPGSGGYFKCAPLGFWQDVYAFLKGLGLKPIFLLGPVETSLKQTLPKESYFVLENIKAAREKLKEGFAFLGHDSGLSHLAGALGLYTLALFGPTRWQNWAPFGRVLVAKANCECLKNNRDPRDCGGLCLKNISFEAFRPIVQKFFNTIPRSSPAHRKVEALPSHLLCQEVKKGIVELGIAVEAVAEEKHYP